MWTKYFKAYRVSPIMNHEEDQEETPADINQGDEEQDDIHDTTRNHFYVPFLHRNCPSSTTDHKN